MAYDRARLERFAQSPVGRAALALPRRYFRATLEGSEHLPRDGGALLVGNHALLGLDGFTLTSLLAAHTDRLPRFLGERNLWKLPAIGPSLTAVGAIPGEPEAATELLAAGELVVVYPGGVDDSFKTSGERHVLKWGSRTGFARIAMRARVPILPVAGLGIDDMFTVLGRERWVGRRIWGSPRYDLPVAVGAFGSMIPRRAPQRFVILPPVDTGGDPEDREAVARVRDATHAALQAALSSAPPTTR